MYTYKFIKVGHSVWTRKPDQNIEHIIDDYAAQGWRLVQVLQEHNHSGKLFSKIILERKVPADFYKNTQSDPPKPDKYNSANDDFV